MIENEYKDLDGLSGIEKIFVDVFLKILESSSEKNARKYLWRLELSGQEGIPTNRVFQIMVSKYEDAFKTTYKPVSLLLDFLMQQFDAQEKQKEAANEKR